MAPEMGPLEKDFHNFCIFRVLWIYINNPTEFAPLVIKKTLATKHPNLSKHTRTLYLRPQTRGPIRNKRSV